MLTPKSVRLSAVGAAAATALTLVLSACTSAQSPKAEKTVTITRDGSTTTTTSPAQSSSPSSSKPSKPALPVTKVHLTGFPDGNTVGVGMPIIVDIYKKITNATDFVKDTKVTVNGRPVQGGWYFEYSDPSDPWVMEAHYRLQHYWPAHAHIHVSFDLKDKPAGIHHHRRLEYDGQLTSLDFHTGARNIAVVNDATHRMTVTSDGKHYGTFPVSLGAPNTPTRSGVKVIMEQKQSVCMTDTASTYYECGIKWDQRLTYDGEYLHSAPWNVDNIGHRDTSNGCTNLDPDAAERLYHFLRIGDVVEFPNADGPKMQMGEGYGDWNVPWSEWQTGGALSTT